MEPACLRHTDLPGTSKLFADFSYHYDRVANFYRHDPHDPASFAAAASEVQYPHDRRAAMARALESQNPGNSLLARFAQPGTLAVVTGQQVGLFSGPAYTIYKALTAARLASDLSARGIPAVPIFWLATEDHDFAEVDHAWVFDASRQPVCVRTPGESRPRPAGTVPVARPPIDELRRALAGFDYADEVVSAVEQSYAPGGTMGVGFRTLLTKLLGRIGVLTMDPLDAGVRAIGAPFMASALEAGPELEAALLARNAELMAAGYHAQVHVDAKTSLFFVLENGDRVALRQKDSPAAALSPNALLRP
ncbi:MAG: bacillithiol biosynthesis protein BshC, partial [Bryobacteraceae bacterium]